VFNRIVCTLWPFLLALTILVSPGIAGVTGTIKQKDPKTFCIEVQITKPAPSTAIITMNVPAGTTITKSEPSYSRFSKERHQAQWLLKDIKPGLTARIIVGFDKNVDLQKIKAIIRYKDPSGNTIESEIKK